MELALGFVDEAIEPKQWVDFTTSKIGGAPDWIKSIYKIIFCDQCAVPMYLLCQLNCPLDHDRRTLYIFICPNHICFTKKNANCVRVLRGMNQDVDNTKHKSALQFETDDWGMDLKEDNLDQSSEWGNPIKPLEPHEINEISLDIKFEKAEDNLNESWEKAFSSSTKKSNVFGPIKHGNFTPYYIAFIPEKDYMEEAEPTLHKLLNDENLQHTEMYEQDDPIHKDKEFHKFLDKVQKAPLQCIRYHYGGKPLLIQNSKNMEILNLFLQNTQCENCGSALIFECQIMPQIINYLKIQNADISLIKNIDFFTILVYTCAKNCLPANIYVNEKALVFPSV